jgi:hypothetical protein
MDGVRDQWLFRFAQDVVRKTVFTLFGILLAA